MRSLTDSELYHQAEFNALRQAHSHCEVGSSGY